MKKDTKINTTIDDEIECEACADHVCNDFCGCILSPAALESKARDEKKEFENIINKIGGIENIKKYYFENTSIIIELKEQKKFDSIIISNKFEKILFNNSSKEIVLISSKNTFLSNQRWFETQINKKET